MARKTVEFQREGYQASVLIYGYNDFKRELKKVAPEVRKAMDAEIKGFVEPVTTRAKTLVPNTVMTNWVKPRNPRINPETGELSRWAVRAWDPGTVRKGITVRQNTKRSRGRADSVAWRIQNKSAAGAIYETAGKKMKPRSQSGVSFINNIMRIDSRPSRLIWRAWDDAGGEKKITAGVVAIIGKYENELQRRLDAAGRD